jgi:hypothetical protein
MSSQQQRQKGPTATQQRRGSAKRTATRQATPATTKKPTSATTKRTTVQRNGSYINDDTKCFGYTSKNNRCENNVEKGQRFCRYHQRPRRRHEDSYFDSNMSRVADHVWIGSLDSANDEKALREACIKCIVNISGWEPYPDTIAMYKRSNIKYCTLTRGSRYLGDQPIGRGLSLREFYDYMDRGLRMVDQCPKYANGKPCPVLIHCHAGINRGGSLVAAWLMMNKGMNFEQAYRAVRQANQKRGIPALTNNDFRRALRHYKAYRQGEFQP